MKRKEFNEIKNKEIKDLKKLSSEKKLEAKKVRMNMTAGKEKNLKIFRNVRRDIAQIMTVIREKEIVENLKPVEEVKVEKKERKKILK